MIIGTRGSDLALWQARWIAKILKASGIDNKLLIISTTGDQVQDLPLNEVGTQGVFTKELENALLAGRIDVAVHSLKDMSMDRPVGLSIAAISERADPADLLIISKEKINSASEFGIDISHFVGTSAIRRSAQIQALIPGIKVGNLRGNVPTRLQKLRKGKFDAIFLAAAGIQRLDIDLSEFKVKHLDPQYFIPSPGQGALAIEMRISDTLFDTVHKLINHKQTAIAVSLERSLLRLFGGGCSLPLGAYALFVSNKWILNAFWGGMEDNPVWVSEADLEPEHLAEKVYEKITRREGTTSDKTHINN
jgi:hydroxymethylbilane synthase